MIELPQCAFCKNYEEKQKCKAYDKIPNEIWNNSIIHSIKYKQKNEILFEPVENKMKK